MRLSYSRKLSEAGGHLIFMTIITAAVIGVALIAYLNVITTQNNFNARSQVWNLCMPIVEAGLEEGLAHINNPGVTNFAAQGWTWNASGSAFTKQRTIGTSYYIANIQTNVANGPSITCTGWVVAPVTVARGRNPLAANMPAPGVSYISRTVKVSTARLPQLSKAIVVKNNINFNGNNALIDSYNSAGGAYKFSAASGDKGDVTADNDAIGNDVSGNASIKGHLATGPKATLKMGPNSVVGSAAWYAGGNKGIQAGWFRKDANVAIPDVQNPWTFGTGTNANSTAGGSYKWTLGAGNYEINGNATVASTEIVYLTGTAKLWIKGDFTLNGKIKVQGANQKLTIYLSGNGTLGGNLDSKIDPTDLIIYGLPTCTTLKITSGSDLEAVIYAPEADLSLIGTAEFMGSLTVNSLAMGGNTGIHYDENLANYPVYLGYVISSWQEL